jgi:four helix bundle protein
LEFWKQTLSFGGVSTQHPPCGRDGKSSAAQQSRDRERNVHNYIVECELHTNTLQTRKIEPMKKLRPSGGYRDTASFQTTTIIYDATVWFCEKFLNARSRTVDQMIQAARSGRQNIAEGSRASATSSQTERRLVNVARSSLDELLLDYEDFLRQRRLPQWASRQQGSQRRAPCPAGNPKRSVGSI